MCYDFIYCAVDAERARSKIGTDGGIGKGSSLGVDGFYQIVAVRIA